MKRLFFLFLIVFPLTANAFSVKSDTSKVNRLDSIIVSAVRAGTNTPVTFSTISKTQLKSVAASHSLPMVLGFQPSVVATTEGGLGLGY
ncbi:MAG: TonB-dependent receptor, partial [Bacteroidales bacterium]|nr:TonB-dependent receptor [Bacteroidales bacterium]